MGVNLLACYGIYRLYRSEQVSVPRPVRLLLVGLRIAAISVLLMVLMAPSLVLLREGTRNPEIAVLVDTSRSITMRDRYSSTNSHAFVTNVTAMSLAGEPPSRAELVSAVLTNRDLTVVESLCRRGNVALYCFGEEPTTMGRVERLDVSEKPSTNVTALITALAAAVTAEGRRTHIADAVRQALAPMRGRPVGGVVLIGDGRDTRGDWVDPVVALCNDRKAPLFCVGVGDPTAVPNARVLQVWAPERVFKDDPFQVETRVQVNGAPVTAVDVTLLRSPTSAPGVSEPLVVERRRATLSDTGEATVRFRVVPEVSGTWAYEVDVEALTGEQIESDNHKMAMVTVLDRRLRVLVVAGTPSWEYRMVRTLLLRDKSMDVSCWLQTLPGDAVQSGNRPITQLPATRAEWFYYDVIVYLDPDPASLSAAWAETMRELVGDQAGGVLWYAGPTHSPAVFAKPWRNGLVAWLPVEPEPIIETSRRIGGAYEREWRAELTPDALDHALMRFRDDPAANRRFVEGLPGFYWCHPVRLLKPGATVLLKHSDRRKVLSDGQPWPLMALGHYGGGRVFYLGMSGTWRWRRSREAVFDHWWIQTVRFLGESRLQRGGTRGRLSTDRDRYAVGDVVKIAAQLSDPAFRPVAEDSIKLAVALPDDTELVRELLPSDVPGRYRGTYVVSQAGLYDLLCTAPGNEATPPDPVTHQFVVEEPVVEFMRTELASSALRRAAAATQGLYMDVSDIESLAEHIPDRTETVTLPEEPVSIWDHAGLLILVLALLGTEWAIRRRYQMI